MSTSDIAIIGMACRLPMANSIDEFWNNLCQGKECLTRFNEADLLAAGASRETIQNPNFVPVKGILSAVDQFDADFFGLTPMEASVMDPQQRLFLECAWEALEHSGNTSRQPDKAIISVFAGMADSCYLQENLLKNKWFRQHYNWMQARVATSLGTLSTQLSYRLNLRGCSVSLNTACSTGLVAVAHACQDLLLARSDLALAGAVAIDLPQTKGYLYEAGGIDSPDGHCRPFAHNANGTVFSNGVGVVVLKRLADAIADRDTVYAVIKGCGVNNDGADKLNYFAPGVSGQASCIRASLKQANLSAADMGFVEAHGTATALGDLVEVMALSEVYREFTQSRQYCVLGSAKGNIGHTDIAAGMASLIKVALCLHHQRIPATLHFERPNPHIEYTDSPFYINQQMISWQPLKNNQYAGVSAFGIGGTNSHLILSAHAASASKNSSSVRQAQLIVLSAKSQGALRHSLENLQNHLSHTPENSSFNVVDLANTLQNGRNDFSWRSMVVADDLDKAIELLNTAQCLPCSQAEPSVVFMFAGQGSQYWQMAKSLYQQTSFFAQTVDHCRKIANDYLPIDIGELIFGEKPDVRLNTAAYAQAALFIIEYSLARLLMHWGIQPAALIGHSSGEYVAACLADILSLSDAIFLVCQRGQLMEKTAEGKMLAITCTQEEFANYQLLFDVELAAHNAVDYCVASGGIEIMNALQQYVEQQGRACQWLKVHHAFHSRFMKSIADDFYKAVSRIQLMPPQLPVISNVTGDLLTDIEAVNPDYWCQHLCQPVQFKKGIDTLIEQGHTFFMEVSPGETLSYLVQRALTEKSISIGVSSALPSSRQKELDYTRLLMAVGRVWQSGVAVNWSALQEGARGRRIALPTYPFERQRCWIENDIRDGDEASIFDKGVAPPQFFQPTWVCRAGLIPDIFVNPCQYVWVIFKDSCGLSDSILSILRTREIEPVIVETGEEYQSTSSQHYTINLTEKLHYVQLFSDLKSRTLDTPMIIIHMWSCVPHNQNLFSSKEIDEHLNRGFYSVLFLAQAYCEQIGDNHPLRCAVVTTCSQKILKEDAVIPVNATLVGVCRVIEQEHPSLKFRLMDVSFDQPEQNLAGLPEAIIQDCLREEWPDLTPLTAFRHGLQWQPDYVSVQMKTAPHRLKDQGVYLITGGLGGIALVLAEIIAKTVSHPVFILVSRSIPPPEMEWEKVLQDSQQSQWHDSVRRIQCLIALGAEVSVQKVDVTQISCLKSVIENVVQTYGQLNGVIHAAGVAGGGLMQLKTYGKAQAVLSPKVHGTHYLAEALSGIPVDFVALCSSVSALVGEPGQIDYCGANACLDAFAVSDMFANASFIVSINWNTWKEVGMTVNTARPGGIMFFELGNDITPAEGQQLFLRILQNDYPQIAVSTSTIAEFTQQVALSTGYQRPVEITSDTIFGESVEKRLLQLWREALGVEHIGMDDDFFALGGHSLRALWLIAAINKAFHCRLSVPDLYAAKTIAGLIARLTMVIEQDRQTSDILVPLRTGHAGKPCLFLSPPVSGMIFCYKTFLSSWELPGDIYGLQDPGILTGKLFFHDLMSMARACVAEIQKIQPHGPYYLVGYSFGGTLAYEIAHLLQQQQETIQLLALIDGWAVFSPEQHSEELFKRYTRHYYPDLSPALINLAWQQMQWLLHHQPSEANLDMILFKAECLLDEYQRIDEPYNGWRQVNKGSIILEIIPADHESIMNESCSLMISHYIQEKLTSLVK